VNAPQETRDPVGAAVQWVAQITTIAVEVVVFIVVGRWLDAKFGTSFCTPIGAILGPSLGFLHLLAMTGAFGRKQKNKQNNGTDRDRRQ